MTTPADLWAPFALRVRCGDLDLRAVTDADLPELTDLALQGVHEPERTPFLTPWTDAPAGELPRNTANFHWSARASFGPAAWTLELVVRRDGEIVGVQGVSTRDYLVVRSGETGSWLGRRFQGQGIGTRMRQAMCVLLFDHLDAQQITSSAFVDNPASLAVSRRVGYVENGTERRKRGQNELALLQRLVLTPDRLVRPAHAVEVEGIALLRNAIGLD